MSSSTITMTPEIYEYLLSVSLRSTEVLHKLRTETASMSNGRMQISPEQGQFMGLLTKLLNVKRYLEVGTFTGYSALSVAAALPEDGKAVCCDISDEFTRVARRYWEEAGVVDKITLFLAPASDTLERLLSEGWADIFDLMFIDADKESYGAYYELGLKLVKPNGLILIDNVLWSGRVAEATVTDSATVALRELNSFIKADKRVDIAMLPVGDGLTLVRKR